MSQAEVSGTILSVSNLKKSFAGIQAVKGVTFDIRRGEVLSLLGDNGAGKSTLIKMLSGAYVADSGDIYFEGRKVLIQNPVDARKLGIEVIYQNLALLDNLSVPANIFMGRELTHSAVPGLMNSREMKRKAQELLDGFGINVGDIGREVRNLSGGQRQMVAISRAVYFKAQVIIMDEPTAALGVAETRKVYEFIDRLKADGISVVIISHNINEVYAAADRFIVLKSGAIVGIKEKDRCQPSDIVSMIISGQDIDN